MRNSISAQSWDSVPPAPALIVPIASAESYSPDSSAASSSFSRSCSSAIDRRRELALELGVGPFFAEQLVERAGVIHLALQGVVKIDLGLQPRELRGDLPGASGIVPERRLGRLSLELVELGALAVDVKGTPWRPETRSEIFARRSV